MVGDKICMNYHGDECHYGSTSPHGDTVHGNIVTMHDTIMYHHGVHITYITINVHKYIYMVCESILCVCLHCVCVSVCVHVCVCVCLCLCVWMPCV